MAADRRNVKRPTSLDVARRAGVSRTTVSYVLNGSTSAVSISEKTREKVLTAARELDYEPSAAGRNLRTQRAGALGLVIREPADRLSADAFLPMVVMGINDVLSPLNMRLVVEHVNASAAGTYVDLIRQGHVDGMIFSNPHPTDLEALLPYRSASPIVVWGSSAGGIYPTVDIDNRNGARAAAEHLIDLGHTRIACIQNAPPAVTGPEAEARTQGYRDALLARSLPVDPALVRPAYFTVQSGFAVTASLLQDRPDVTAVFAASDEVALGAMLAVRASGRSIPGDVSIVGFDDIPSAAVSTPPLTTIRASGTEIGAAAARLCLDPGEPAEPGPHVLIDGSLVIRQSSGPVPAR